MHCSIEGPVNSLLINVVQQHRFTRVPRNVSVICTYYIAHAPSRSLSLSLSQKQMAFQNFKLMHNFFPQKKIFFYVNKDLPFLFEDFRIFHCMDT